MDSTGAYQDDYSTQLRTLLNDYAAHGRRLRELHEQYLALPQASMGNEQRREALRDILDAELVVLEGVQGIQQMLDALLKERQSYLRLGT